MARADKEAAVAELAEAFRESSAAVLTEYRGLTVGQLKELRTALAGNATYAVVKNTLTKIAAREAGVDGIEELLQGPSAIAFVTGDPVEVAKGLRSFGREHPPLVVKGGVLDGRPLTADEIRRLADLESRDVLLAKLAGGMKASLQQAINLFTAPLSQFARLAAALEAKAKEEPSLLAGVGSAPSEEAAAEATDLPATTETAVEEAKTAAPPPGASGAAAATDLPEPADSATAELSSDGIPGVEQTPDTTAADAAGDEGGAVQAVADATDVPPTTDVAGDATSIS